MEEVAQKLHFEAHDMQQNEELNISCRTNSSGCDVDDMLDTSTEDFGSPPPLQPRKLSFNSAMDCGDSPETVRHPTVNNNNKMPPAVAIG